MTNLRENPEEMSPGEREHYLMQFAEELGRVQDAGLDIIETNADKPWGAYACIDPAQVAMFTDRYFPGITLEELTQGNPNAPLSLKIMGVFPGHRLSLQFHNRRAERWRFITAGGYRESDTDEEGDRIEAQAGDIVQFARRARHRLEGRPDGMTLVAEIWQHSDPDNPSDEDDIVRLADDYTR
jgi:mannose-6-phosphate isomerase-like protein (cupin superfamily)